jgi:hypothetical protein
VLNLGGRKSIWQWLRQVEPRNAMFLLKRLRRTQRMMDPRHYLGEYDLGSPAVGQSRHEWNQSRADDHSVWRQVTITLHSTPKITQAEPEMKGGIL